MDSTQFLDEFRPFRRGELALARRMRSDPLFLPEAELDLIRYALRLAQLSSLRAGGPAGERDALVDRIGFARLRLLQLLAPALPTDPDQIDARALLELAPRVARLVHDARLNILEAEQASETALDDEVGQRQLALVLGGSAGSGYIYLGALARLEQSGLRPSYLVGCSMGAILAVLRARDVAFDLGALLEELGALRARAAFRAPSSRARYGLPAALRLDLRAAIGYAFQDGAGGELTLGDLPLPVDALATGIGRGALGSAPEEYAHLIGQQLEGAADLADLRTGALARAVAAIVSLAMSRRLLVPVMFGQDPETRALQALDVAGFSAAIPAIFHYDLDASSPALDSIFAKHDLVSLCDGSVASAVPARFAWEAIEQGRIGTRNCAVVALDALAAEGAISLPLRPLQRVVAATSERDKAYWDLRVRFRRAPPLIDVFPREAVLARAAEEGAVEFEEPARLLEQLLAPVPRWSELLERTRLVF